MGNELLEKLRDEATAALVLIRSREQQQQQQQQQDNGEGKGKGEGAVDDDAGSDGEGEVEKMPNQEDTDLEKALEESEQYADQQEGASLADALLRSKIDMESGNEIVLLRLTSY